MKHVVIICAQPGFRRAGIEHPARKVYAPGELSDELIERLRGEPLLSVTFADNPESATAGPADGTLPSAGRGEVDTLAVVLIASGAPGALAGLIAKEVYDLAEVAVVGHLPPLTFVESASARARRLLEEHGFTVGSGGFLKVAPPAEADGHDAQPEPEAGAPASGSEVSSLPDGVSSLAVPTSEAGVATGGASAADPVVTSETGEATEAATAAAPVAAKARRGAKVTAP
ncbi:hypothetical protein [Ancylobacter defluvii]|uniref:Uncharacterized protein n=1 Tax=Ancylobacter defluvii TaxID=1282440 RepID=A0A9W6NCL6_9HYPH|nr:hypothetical protein [Ancylobacter defluvii]MBS7586410.1 hypothetical protein [Ancylobacter defluvii]GLK85691.1 hypothetical protein GCM10017653_37610 [Ancylobacter defluvii]